MEYILGHIEKLHVSDLLNSRVLDDCFILLTCVDSDCNVTGILDYHQSKGIEQIIYKKLGGAVALTCRQLQKASEQYNLLNGFDEIWCFKEYPVLEKPEDVVLCGVEKVERDKIVDWMEKSGCVIGAGDGFGLNYITCDSSVHGLFLNILNR